MSIGSIKTLENTPAKAIQICLQDYSNEFLGIESILKTAGIETVQKILKGGHKVPSIEEYLKKYRDQDRDEIISEKDQKHPSFIEKAKILDELANQINASGGEIDAEKIKEIIEKVKEVIYNKK